MTPFIGSTDAQKFRFYTLPDAKARVGDKEKMRPEIAAEVRRLRDEHKNAKTDIQRRKCNRRIRAQIDEWHRVCRMHDEYRRLISLA